MTKIQKVLSTALCFALLFSLFTGPADKTVSRQIMFFPGLSLGSYAKTSDKDEKITVVDDKEKVEYSFRILELFDELFRHLSE